MEEKEQEGFFETGNIKALYWTSLGRGGLTLQDIENKDAWLAMREAVDLHKWK